MILIRTPLLRVIGMLGTITTIALVPVPAQNRPGSADQFQSLLERGFAQHQHADYQHSIPTLTSAWKLRPHDYFANLLIGIDLLRTGKAADAIDYLKEASRQRPKEDFPYDYIGEAYAVRGLYAEAAEALARAIELAPDSSQAVESSVGLYVERFRQLSASLRSTDEGLAAEYRLRAMSRDVTAEKREELLQQSASLDPHAPGIWSDLALANLALAHRPAAQENVGRASRENPNDLVAKEVNALMAAQDGEWPVALANLNQIAETSRGAFERALADWPPALQPPRELPISGKVAVFLNCAALGQRTCPGLAAGSAARSTASMSMAAAKTSRKKLLEQQRWESVTAQPVPRGVDATVWFDRGIAFAQLNQCSAAIPALERAVAVRNEGLSLHNKMVYAQFLLSRCYASEAGRITSALDLAKGTEAIDHLVRGDVLLRLQGNSAAAIAEYTTALAARGNDPKVLEKLAEAQFANGNFDAAAETAQATLKIDPYRPSAIETLAGVAMQQRKYDKALPYLEKLAQLRPADLKAQVDLGVALAKTGDLQQALKYLEPPLQQGYADENGNLHSLLGSVLSKAGRSEEATNAFREARRLSDQYQHSSHRGGDEQKHEPED